MTNKSNNQGRAYEYIFLITLDSMINVKRKAKIDKNSSYLAAERGWNAIGKDIQQTLTISAKAAVPVLFDLEPMILEDDGDMLELRIQKDSKGETGDVRDILIIRSDIMWEIGLSLKHNHFAVKHSRLSKGLDFGLKWFGRSCSSQYWNDVDPVFKLLEAEKTKGHLWEDMSTKKDNVYAPLLKAFMDEIRRSNEESADLPRKMVEYLLGEYDFYKVISLDRDRLTQIHAYNLRGKLNKSGRAGKPKIAVPVSSLPTRIIYMGLKPNSKNTVEICMDKGWQFSFRIHNATKIVETSLKFDVQIVGMPADILVINCQWR